MDLTNADLRGAVLNGADLARAVLNNAALNDAQLREVNLTGASLLRASIAKADLSRATLNGAKFCESRGERVQFVGATAIAADFSRVQLQGNFSGIEAPQSIFASAVLTGSFFNDAKMKGSVFESAILDHVSFLRALLAEARFGLAKFDDANFVDCDLESCNFTNVRGKGPAFAGAKMIRALLSAVEFEGGSFASANMREARLSNASLIRCDLREADLTGAALGSCSLAGTDARRAVFIGASLEHVDFDGVCLLGAKGLHGPKRAIISRGRNEEFAVFSRSGDWVPWSTLRLIGAVRLFGVSYAAFVVITSYALAVQFLNDTIRSIKDHWSASHPDGYVRELLEEIPYLPVEGHFGVQLLMIAMLAVAATLYAIGCPDPIKEATETRWARELAHSVVEYRAAAFSGGLVRYCCAVCYFVGGIYTLLYLAINGISAIAYLLGVN